LEQHPGASSAASPDANSTTSPSQPREPGLPVIFMYGENDWMDVKGGYAAKKKMDAETKRLLAEASSEDKARDQGSAKVVIIKNAGHHLYLDNAEDFNEAVLREMEDVRKKNAQ